MNERTTDAKRVASVFLVQIIAVSAGGIVGFGIMEFLDGGDPGYTLVLLPVIFPEVTLAAAVATTAVYLLWRGEE